MKKILDLIKKLLSGNKAQKAIAAVQIVKEVKQEVKPAGSKPKKKKYYPSKPKANI